MLCGKSDKYVELCLPLIHFPKGIVIKEETRMRGLKVRTIAFKKEIEVNYRPLGLRSASRWDRVEKNSVQKFRTIFQCRSCVRVSRRCTSGYHTRDSWKSDKECSDLCVNFCNLRNARRLHTRENARIP